MNSLLYYYNNVQKMAAYQQATRMQRGVKLGYNEAPTSSSTLKFTSSPIHIGTDDFSIEFWGNTYGASGSFYNPTLFFNNGGTDTFSIGVNSIGTNGVQWVHFGRDAAGGTGQDILGPNYIAPTQEGMFHCVVTRSGTLVKCFIEGEQKAQKTQTLLHDYGDVTIGIANSSNMGFVRVWNYALSADDIATLYNNGDPVGYVVPKASRYFERSYHSNFTEGTDGWIAGTQNPNLSITSDNSVLSVSGDYSNYYLRLPSSMLPKYASRYKFRIEFEEPITASRFQLFAYSADTAYEEFLTEPKTILEGVTPTSKTGIPNTNLFFYLYGLTPNTVVKIKSISIEPVGLLAEYLPQNLMESRKGPEVEPTADVFEFDMESPYFENITPTNIVYPYRCAYEVEYVVEEMDIRTVNGNIDGAVGFGGQLDVKVFGDANFRTFQPSDVGKAKTFVAVFTGNKIGYISLYAGNFQNEFIARHLKVTIKGVTPVSIPSSWLDSAKQLPLSDESMEPLFQSIGGYDMTANGAPEIIFNE